MMAGILAQFRPVLEGPFSDEQRRQMMDYGEPPERLPLELLPAWLLRRNLPNAGFRIVAFLDLALEYVEHSLRANQRGDNLFTPIIYCIFALAGPPSATCIENAGRAGGCAFIRTADR